MFKLVATILKGIGKLSKLSIYSYFPNNFFKIRYSSPVPFKPLGKEKFNSLSKLRWTLYFFKLSFLSKDKLVLSVTFSKKLPILRSSSNFSISSTE